MSPSQRYELAHAGAPQDGQIFLAWRTPQYGHFTLSAPGLGDGGGMKTGGKTFGGGGDV